MKKVKLVFGILFVSFFFTTVIIAQEQTGFDLNRKIELKDDSKTKTIKIEVNKKNCQFNLKIRSLINAGEVKIELFDHENKKQGNFSVGCQIQAEYAINAIKKNKSIETVNGQITKYIVNPPLGEWTIRIHPKNSVGQVQIEFSQSVIIKKPTE